MNKICGFIYNMSFGTPPKGRNHEEPSIPMDYGSPLECGGPTQVYKLNDIAQITALSYRSAFGFIFLMTDTNNVKKVLKVYFLDPRAGENTDAMDFELANKYEAMNPSKKVVEAMNPSKKVVEAMNPSKKVVEAMNLSKAKPFVSGFDEDDNIGYPKRVESTLNFNKEVEIQKEVYLASSSNGPLCPQIYDSYIVENYESRVFLQGLLKKCINDKQAQNMIQYLIKNINGRSQSYDIGCILMEYAEGYTISTADNSENVIYANIRLLLETGYLHLDLNYGNVMVSGENVRLIDFGKSKKILDLLTSDKDRENFNNNIYTIAKKEVLQANDIIQLIECINSFDKKYGLNNLNSGGLFEQNFVGNKNTSYENIAVKLNVRENKIIHTDLMNEATQPPPPSQKSRSNIFSSPSPSGKDLFDSPPENVFISNSMVVDSPPQKTGKRLFGETDDDNPNLITPRKGGTTKRKHKKRTSKRRSKKRQNKKRVKLISKK